MIKLFEKLLHFHFIFLFTQLIQNSQILLVCHLKLEHVSSLRANIADLEEESSWVHLLLSVKSKTSCRDEHVIQVLASKLHASQLVDIEVVVAELDLVFDLLVPRLCEKLKDDFANFIIELQCHNSLDVDLQDLALSENGDEEIVILIHCHSSQECFLAIALIFEVHENILVIYTHT